jgi:nitrate/nitrite transporter NarK
MLQRSADRPVQSDGAIPYWRLWSACFLGFGAIGMTMQVMPAYAHERLGADAITAGLAVTIGSLATMFSRPVSDGLSIKAVDVAWRWSERSSV